MSMAGKRRADPAIPRSLAFRRDREHVWAELDELVEKVLRGGLHVLDSEQLRRLPMLYRATVSSLAVARKTALDKALVAYLEALAARAYLAMYGSRKATRGSFRRALMVSFPQNVRAMSKEVGVAFLITLLGMVVAAGLMQSDIGWYDAFVAPELAGGRDPQASTESLRDALYGGGEEALSLFATYLFTHNAGIGLMAFALGFAAGIPTALLLFTNGLMLGAFLSLYASRGLLVPLVGWLLPHGIPEIGAIVLCGAAGLHLGRAMLMPGQYTLREAIRRAGQRASMVVFGCIVLFAIAGVVEGIFRQVILDDRIRFGLAAFNALWFFGWLLLGGRPKRLRRERRLKAKK